jgi:hypothetical protein
LVDARPPLRRIIVSPDDEGTNAVLGKPLEAPEKTKLSPYRSFSPVTDVTSEQEEGCLVVNGQLNESIPRCQWRLAQHLSDGGRGATKSLERDIQV